MDKIRDEIADKYCRSVYRVSLDVARLHDQADMIDISFQFADKILALPSLRAEREEIEKLRQTIRTAYAYVKNYSNDADMATHAKRILWNAKYEFDGERIEAKEEGR